MKLMLSLVAGLSFWLTSAIVFAQTAVPSGAPTPIPEGDISGAMGVVMDLVKAAAAGDYLLAVGLGLMVAVFVVRTYLWKKLNKQWIPIAAALLATATWVGSSLAIGTELTPALIDGIEVGVSAVGLWELWKAVKRVIVKPK